MIPSKEKHSTISKSESTTLVELQAIELSRPQGKYRAGEVLRGNLVLFNPDSLPLQCHCSATFQGTARTEFHSSNTEFIKSSSASEHKFQGHQVLQTSVAHIRDYVHGNAQGDDELDRSHMAPYFDTKVEDKISKGKRRVDPSPYPTHSSVSACLSGAFGWRSSQQDKRIHNHDTHYNTPRHYLIQVPPQTKLRVPFAFPIRHDAPGSIQLPLNSNCKGAVDYYVHARVATTRNNSRTEPFRSSSFAAFLHKGMSRHPAMNQEERVVVTIVPQVSITPQPNHPLLQPVLLEKQNVHVVRFSKTSSSTSSFLDSANQGNQHHDTISLSIQVPQRVFRPGQALDFTGSWIRNQTSRKQLLVVGLRMHMKLHGRGSPKQIVGQSAIHQHHDFIIYHQTLAAGALTNLKRYRIPASAVPCMMNTKDNQENIVQWSYELYAWCGDKHSDPHHAPKDTRKTKGLLKSRKRHERHRPSSLVQVTCPIVIVSESPAGTVSSSENTTAASLMDRRNQLQSTNKKRLTDEDTESSWKLMEDFSVATADVTGGLDREEGELIEEMPILTTQRTPPTRRRHSIGFSNPQTPVDRDIGKKSNSSRSLCMIEDRDGSLSVATTLASSAVSISANSIVLTAEPMTPTRQYSSTLKMNLARAKQARLERVGRDAVTTRKKLYQKKPILYPGEEWSDHETSSEDSDNDDLSPENDDSIPYPLIPRLVEEEEEEEQVGRGPFLEVLDGEWMEKQSLRNVDSSKANRKMGVSKMASPQCFSAALSIHSQ